MTDQELDALLQRILLDVYNQNTESKGSGTAIARFRPSRQYQRQMALMLADPLKWVKRRNRPVWKQALGRVAVILLVISIAFGGLMATSSSVRAAVTRWVVEWYETHIVYRYTGEAITEAMPRYEIAELPEGYVEVEDERIEKENYVSIVYQDSETGKTLYLDYIYMQQGSAIDLVTEGVEIEPIKVNGLDGRLLFVVDDWENQQSTVTWVDPDKNIQFSVSAHLSNSDILRMAESVYLVES